MSVARDDVDEADALALVDLYVDVLQVLVGVELWVKGGGSDPCLVDT